MEKIIESNKEQDTYDLGYELGQHAKPGQVFTLVGDLGVGKTVFTKDWPPDLALQSRSAVRHLQLCRCMMKGACRSIILMFTGSVTLKRWRRSDLMNIFLVRASA